MFWRRLNEQHDVVDHGTRKREEAGLFGGLLPDAEERAREKRFTRVCLRLALLVCRFMVVSSVLTAYRRLTTLVARPPLRRFECRPDHPWMSRGARHNSRQAMMSLSPATNESSTTTTTHRQMPEERHERARRLSRRECAIERFVRRERSFGETRRYATRRSDHGVSHRHSRHCRSAIYVMAINAVLRHEQECESVNVHRKQHGVLIRTCRTTPYYGSRSESYALRILLPG